MLLRNAYRELLLLFKLSILDIQSFYFLNSPSPNGNNNNKKRNLLVINPIIVMINPIIKIVW